MREYRFICKVCHHIRTLSPPHDAPLEFLFYLMIKGVECENCNNQTEFDSILNEGIVFRL